MSTDPFIGDICMISWNFPPKGWAFCNGQLMAINQNQALFSLLGTTYGGDGRTTFALPNLQGRTYLHMGGGFVLGEQGGETTHTLNISELPTHTHLVNANSAAGTLATPLNNVPAQGAKAAYGSTADLTMSAGAVSVVGGNQPHENMPPYLVLNFIIALQGIFPSQN
jgi:microcystin-dependent protein